jgi:uncharacterized protein YbjT (DUF2867 family)
MTDFPDLGLAVVAGATGGTGRTIVAALQRHGVPTRALVRDPDRARSTLGGSVEVVAADLFADGLAAHLAGAASLFIAIGSRTRQRQNAAGKTELYYDPEGSPERIDYAAQVHLIDAATAARVPRVVLISSIGATDPNHFLNRLGNGNVLRWKFKSEEHLRASGLAYTIVRPGALTDAPGGQESLVVNVGDVIKGSISRDDVGELAVQALVCPGARNLTFEVYAEPGTPTTDWVALYEGLAAKAAV